MTALTFLLVVATGMFAIGSAHYARTLYRRLQDARFHVERLSTKLEHEESSYRALLQRANELSQEKVAAGRLVHDVEGYLAVIKDEVKGLLHIHGELRRGLERIASFRKPVEDGNYTETLKEMAAQTLEKVGGLTLAGTVEEVALRIAKSPTDPEVFQTLQAAGGVCADQRNVKVDLSGQVKRIRSQREVEREIREVTDALREACSKPLNGELSVAAERLGTKDLAIDQTPKGTVIVTAAPYPEEHRVAQQGVPSGNNTVLSPLDYGFLSPVGKD